MGVGGLRDKYKTNKWPIHQLKTLGQALNLKFIGSDFFLLPQGESTLKTSQRLLHLCRRGLKVEFNINDLSHVSTISLCLITLWLRCLSDDYQYEPFCHNFDNTSIKEKNQPLWWFLNDAHSFKPLHRVIKWDSSSSSTGATTGTTCIVTSTPRTWTWDGIRKI